MSDQILTYGAIDLTGDAGSSPFLGYTENDESPTGAPEPLFISLPRQMLDGEIVGWERDSNRLLEFFIEVTAVDPLGLNEAEADLVREVRKPRNALSWKPPGMNTPVTVFDTFTGSLRQRGEWLTFGAWKRVYQVTIPALPHARSESQSTASLAGRSLVTSLDTCESATGWSGTSVVLDGTTYYQGTHSIKASASLTLNSTGGGSGGNLLLTRTGTVALAAGANIVAAFKGSNPMSGAPWLQYTSSDSPNGSAVVVDSVALLNGWTEYTWALGNEDPITVTSLDFRPLVGVPSPSPGEYTVSAWIDHVRYFTEAPPADLAGLRLLQTGGSVRTPGTLRLSNATDPLGTVMVSTWGDENNGFRPDASRWYAGEGTLTADADSVSGQNFGSGSAFDVPNRTLAPGPYAVFVKPTDEAVPPLISLTAQTWAGGAATGPAVNLMVNPVDAAVLPVGVLHLPASATPAQSVAATRLKVTGMGDGTIDEVWLFRMDGQLTWLQDLDTQRVWLESPSPSLPYGGVWIGDEDDMSDARHPGDALRMLGRHVFESPVAAVYVAATGAAPSMDLLHYRTWHSNAAS